MGPPDIVGPPDEPLNRMQITMQRQIATWPIYCIILGFGQMLSATSSVSLSVSLISAAASPALALSR